VVDVKLVQDETGRAEELAEGLAEAYRERTTLEYMTALRQKLELLKVPHLVEFTEHYARTSRVVVFVNYTATIEALQKAYRKIFTGPVPVINGENSGAERDRIKLRFQNNEEPVLICNVQAGGIGIGLHDPTGQVERTTLISPCYSARQAKQVLGRTPRDGGAYSQQFFVYFANTLEAEVASALRSKLENLDALNDAILHGVVPINDRTPTPSSEAQPTTCKPSTSSTLIRREEAQGNAQPFD
jgi:superfamily II DNA or RNA helicase